MQSNLSEILPPTMIGGQEFIWGARTYVMGIVNVTPDSFSGDGTLAKPSEIQFAVDQALRMEDEGADIVDIGGESTRPKSVYPDANPVGADDEIARVIPVIQALKGRLSVPISIDTNKAPVADQAIESGAVIINDVSMLGDSMMANIAIKKNVPIVLSHIRKTGHSGSVVDDVLDDLRKAIDVLSINGVTSSNVIVDPGIGFAKTAKESLQLVRNISRIRSKLSKPVLVGSSRKSFIAAITGEPIEDRRFGTAATVAFSIQGRVDIVRVHDVREMVNVAKMSDSLTRKASHGGA